MKQWLSAADSAHQKKAGPATNEEGDDVDDLGTLSDYEFGERPGVRVDKLLPRVNNWCVTCTVLACGVLIINVLTLAINRCQGLIISV